MTITLDRSKANEARRLMGAASTSEVIAVALERLIHAERLRRDIAAYRAMPPRKPGAPLAFAGATELLADDTDWEALANWGPAEDWSDWREPRR